MKEEFIPYKESLDLKELGFDEPCLSIYNNKKEFSTVGDLRCPYTYLNNTHSIHIEGNGVICIPLYQQAFRWFREKHNLYHSINHSHGALGIYHWEIIDSDLNGIGHSPYYSFEEAEIACLRKLIEIVKENK